MALNLFEGYGIEIELMVADAETLNIAPAADWLLARAAGRDNILDLQSAPEELFEINDGPVGWCNELAQHVIEFRCNGPATSLVGLARQFQTQVQQANSILAERGLCLLPGPMHPWMNPDKEFRLWPHGDTPFYDQFDSIFDCRGHGWSNLQSTHINLPFGDEAQFGRLHAAIRAILPLLPSLAAGSPYMDGKLTGWADTRLAVYRDNCKRIPSITGQVIPEPVYSFGGYQDLLSGLYRDIAALDPQGALQDEWLNARGAIARFGRDAIEIRLLDAQEGPVADLAIAELVCAAVRLLTEEHWADLNSLQKTDQQLLVKQLEAGMQLAEAATVRESAIAKLVGWQGNSNPATATIWEHLADAAVAQGWLTESAQLWVEHYLRYGSLSTRLQSVVGNDVTSAALHSAYRQMADALAACEWFGSGH